MIEAKKNPPAGNQGNPKTTSDDTPILAPSHDGLVAGVYVAVVQIKGDHTPARYRRRVFLNLPAANRAISRAHMDGLDASVVLCQLIPVSGGLDD